MKQIVVTRDIAYSYNNAGTPAAITNIKEINTLGTGSLAIFTEGGVLVTAANMGTVLDDVKKCYFAVGNQQSAAAAKSMITVPFPRSGKVSYTKQAYTAPVKAKKVIGNDGTTGSLNLPTAATGNLFTMKIINTTPGLRTIGAVEGKEIFNYEISQLAGETNAQAITRFIAWINADPDRIVNATVVGGQVGITFDAIDYGTTFAIALDESLLNATVYQQDGSNAGATSLAVVYGIGTSDQIAAIEDQYAVERGKTNNYIQPQKWYSNPSLVVDGATYNVYTIEWVDDRVSAMEGRQETGRKSIIVAIPAGTALATSFETIMPEVFAGTVSTSPVETGS